MCNLDSFSLNQMNYKALEKYPFLKSMKMQRVEKGFSGRFFATFLFQEVLESLVCSGDLRIQVSKADDFHGLYREETRHFYLKRSPAAWVSF